jgi:hypothetical protein
MQDSSLILPSRDMEPICPVSQARVAARDVTGARPPAQAMPAYKGVQISPYVAQSGNAPRRRLAPEAPVTAMIIVPHALPGRLEALWGRRCAPGLAVRVRKCG